MSNSSLTRTLTAAGLFSLGGVFGVFVVQHNSPDHADVISAVSARQADYVVHISVDALHAGAVAAWGPKEVPNFWRFRTEGAWTDNARTDFSTTVTSPSHATILTGRPVHNWPRYAGHLWGENSASDPVAYWRLTLHQPHIVGQYYNGHQWTAQPSKTTYQYVSSTFDVVHDAGLKTGLFSGKARLFLEKFSVDAAHSDNGTNKVDVAQIPAEGPSGPGILVDAWAREMATTRPIVYSFFNLSYTDETVHATGCNLTPNNNSGTYMFAVKVVDGALGRIFRVIAGDSRFAGRTAIILTADHGCRPGTTEHGKVDDVNDYTVPFYVWGPGAKHGANLYSLNPQYQDPGTSRVDYSRFVQPIRNGDGANLAMAFLGLTSIPGSSMNRDQTLTAGDGGVTRWTSSWKRYLLHQE